jgi:hypothetical protein
MDESAFPTNGRDDNQTARRTEGSQPPGERGQAEADPSPATPLETKPTNQHKGRLGRILPWVIAAIAVLVAAIAIGAFAVNEASKPKSVAQLAPQTDSTAAIPMDDEAARTFELNGVTQDDFVSHGSYGLLQVWSATTPKTRCLALVGGDHVSVFHCTPPWIDTIADFRRVPGTGT